MSAVIDYRQWQQELFGGLLADRVLLFLIAALVSFGVVMVASASITFASELGGGGNPWYFTQRQIVFLCIGATACAVVACTPLAIWRQYGWAFLLLAIGLLIVVLIPGVGQEVNGSRRWLRVGPINIQASELAKFCCLVFFASFLSKWHEEIKTTNWQIIKPLAALALVLMLILLEPDLGTTAVLCISMVAMMFLAGIKIWQCLVMAVLAGGAFAALIFVTPWRVARLVTFRDPWQYEFGNGYQLTQSLIGFGRGEWVGLGLGNSLQKLRFLPEAHTDFVFSIVAEEFGFIGVLVVLGLFVALIAKAFMLAKRAIGQDKDFACYAAFGVGVLLACQVFINVGVASGMLPTKGLTLPFVSYGGSSLIVSLMMMGLLIRIQKELQPTLKPLAEVKRS